MTTFNIVTVTRCHYYIIIIIIIIIILLCYCNVRPPPPRLLPALFKYAFVAVCGRRVYMLSDAFCSLVFRVSVLRNAGLFRKSSAERERSSLLTNVVAHSLMKIKGD